jgi:hypothetical protein
LIPGPSLLAGGHACAPPDGPATRPARVRDAEEYRLDDEMLVYVSRSETAYVLNRSAAAIWELCDGTRTVEEITVELGQCVGRSGADLLPDVVQGVARLREAGLVDLR